MERILCEPDLREAVQNSTLIKGGMADNCEGIKYDFRLSNKVLRADFSRPLEFEHALADSQEKLIIEPGEVAFVITEESLELPNNVYCLLSSKRKLSHGGIVILGGFTIDPLYKGKLIFGLYNISSRRYPIMPGRKLIAGVFYESDQNIASPTQNPPAPINDFPDDLIAMIKEYKPVSNNAIEALGSSIRNLQNDINSVKQQLNDDRTWKETFKAGLEQNNRQLEENNRQIKDISNTVQKLAESIASEREERMVAVSGLKESVASSKLIGTLGIGLLMAILGGGISLLVAWIAGVLSF